MTHDPTKAIRGFAERNPEFFAEIVAFFNKHQDDYFRAGWNSYRYTDICRIICNYQGMTYKKLSDEEALIIRRELDVIKENDPLAYMQFAALIKDYVYRWHGMGYSHFLRYVFAVYDSWIWTRLKQLVEKNSEKLSKILEYLSTEN